MEVCSIPKSEISPVVIGYGNPIRQDDAMGWRAAELVQAGAIQEHQLTPELVIRLKDAPLVIFLDAAVDLHPGSIRLKALRPDKVQTWSHHIGPEQLLGLAEQVNGTAPPAFLISGGVEETGLSDHMTVIGEKCAASMANLARRLLAGYPGNTLPTRSSAVGAANGATDSSSS